MTCLGCSTTRTTRAELARHVVIRRADEPEVYAATTDLHEHCAPESVSCDRDAGLPTPPALRDVRAGITGD